MNARHFTIGIGMVLLLASAGNSAEGKTKRISCAFSGTVVGGVETHLDTNGDGISAGTDQGLGNCNIGRFFFQEEGESQAPLPAPVTCPAGTLEFHTQQDHGVLIEEKTGDQLFFEIATGGSTLCFNLSDLTFSVTGQGTFTGGTGHFTGATGEFQDNAHGSLLVTGQKDGVFGAFGQFSSIITGTLTIPRHSD